MKVRDTAQMYGRIILSGICVVVCCLAFVPTTSADSILIHTAAEAGLSDKDGDTLVDAFEPFYPNDTFLRVFGHLVTGGPFTRAALEFDLSGIAAGATVNAAIFRVSDRGTTYTGGALEFYGYSGDGVMQVSDGNLLGNLIASTAILDGDPTYFIDVTSFIQSLVNDGAAYGGIVLKSSVESRSGFHGADLCSSSGRDVGGGHLSCYGAEPILWVTSNSFEIPPAPPNALALISSPVGVPESCSLLLLAFGLAGVIAVKVRGYPSLKSPIRS